MTSARKMIAAAVGLGCAVVVGGSPSPTSAQSASAAGPEAEADQWLCQGEAIGRRAFKVDVQLYVKRDHSLVGRSFLWSPPLVASGRQTGLPARNASLIIEFDDAAQPSPAAPTSVGVLFGSESRQTESVGLEFDDGPAWTSTVEQFPAGSTHYQAEFPAWPSSQPQVDTDGLRAMQHARRVKVLFLDRSGTAVGWDLYDLSGRAQLRLLFHRALLIAARKARHLETCDKSEVDPREPQRQSELVD